MKINISINDDLLSKADSYAEQNFLSRSGLISLALTQLFNQYEMIKTVKELGALIERVSQESVLDEALRSQYDDFKRLYALLHS